MRPSDSAVLYVEGDSAIHRLNPLTKLTYTLVALALLFVWPRWEVSLSVLALAVILLTSAGAVGRFLTVTWGLAAVFIPTLFIIQGLWHPGNRTVLLTLGPLQVGREGVLFAADLSLRLLAILATSLFLMLTTRPSGLVEALVAHGFPPRMGYALQLSLQILPTMAATARRIAVVQQARGIEVGGTLLARARGLLPLLGPLLRVSLVAVQERAMALEVRGFGARGRRTSFAEQPDRAWERGARWVLAASLAAVAAGRLIGWLSR
ncbi:MAG: energy-coupling factor transporter transmembrane component T family protein [Candidatus Methylomirabilales bacterium]